jgi:hypothetical protein
MENTHLSTPRIVREYPFLLVLHVEDLLAIGKRCLYQKTGEKTNCKYFSLNQNKWVHKIHNSHAVHFVADVCSF